MNRKYKMRVNLIAFLLLLVSYAAFAGNADDTNLEANWLYDIEVAKEEAKEKNQYILLSFSGSDWCIPCMRLEKDLFTDKAFVDFSKESLTLVRLDFPVRKRNSLPKEQIEHNEALAAQYNPKGNFPLVVIINPAGEVQGYMKQPAVSTEAYLESLREILSQ